MRLASLLLISTICASLSCGGGSRTVPPPPGAISWEQVSTPSSQVNFIDFAANGHWFIADRNQGFYRSTDGGSNWTQINSGIATQFGWTINAVPGNGNLIAAIYSSGGVNVTPVIFYRSSDEGSSWTAIQSGALDQSPAWTGCAFAANSSAVCGGYWAPFPTSGAWYSNTSGQTAIAATTATNNGDAVLALASNSAKSDLWMGTEQYGVFRSTDNGATWTVASPPDTQIDPVHGIPDGNIFAITFDRSGNVLFGAQGGIWKSASSGNGYTWTNVKNNSNTADGIALARDSNGTLYYGHGHDASDPVSVYCSTDDGITWNACDQGLAQSLVVFRFAVNPVDRKLYAVARNESTGQALLYRTVNPVQ